MKLRLARDCFAREADGEGVWVCPKGAGGCRVEGGGMLARLTGREWRVEGEIFAAIAAASGVSATEVAKDFGPIVGELFAAELLDVEDDGSAIGFFLEHGMPVSCLSETKEAWPAPADCREVMGFWKDHGIPAELHVDLTTACTERCVHCYFPGHETRHLEFGLAEKALREFRESGGLTVHLTGGECMLHPRFEDACRLCAELGLNFVAMSNLTACDRKRAAFLGELRPQFVNVSLYSMDEAEHDAVTTVPGSWRRTMEAIGECEKAGVPVRLAAPLLKENRKAFPGLKRFADGHGMHLVPECTIAPRSNQDCSNLAHACSEEELEETLQANPDIFDRNWGAAPMPGAEEKVCGIGEGRLYLNAEGNYYPCDGMHGFVLGNARERTVEEIWKGEELDAFRRLKNRDFGACAACGHRPFCKVCPAFNFNATGNVAKTIPEKCAVAAVLHRVYGRA